MRFLHIAPLHGECRNVSVTDTLGREGGGMCHAHAAYRVVLIHVSSQTRDTRYACLAEIVYMGLKDLKKNEE